MSMQQLADRTLIFPSSGLGKSPTSMNPVANFAHESSFAMELLVKMSGLALSPGQLILATELAIKKAANGEELSIRAVVELWEPVPELSNFAKALRKATLPGEYGKFFN